MVSAQLLVSLYSHLIIVIRLLTVLLFDCLQLSRKLHLNINFLLESSLPPSTAWNVQSHYATTEGAIYHQDEQIIIKTKSHCNILNLFCPGMAENHKFMLKLGFKISMV